MADRLFRFIAVARIRTPVSIRRLFAILLALSVLIAPSVTSAAMAAAPQHAMQMMEAGHCHMPTAPADHGNADGKSCCISMCMAVAVAPSAPAEVAPPRQQMAQFAPPAVYQGTLTEIATPPPRHS
jgi:hypothetical protein